MWAKQKRLPSGFTIVELLIVVVVIGILAAITLVAYANVQTNAKKAAANSAAAQASKKIRLWLVENPGTAPDCATFSTLINASGSTCTATVGNTSYQYSPLASGSYCLTATVGDQSYKATDTAQPTSGGCAGHGVGGVDAITNLATNPSFEANTTSWAASSATLARSTAWADSGTSSVLVTPNAASADSFVRIGGTSTLPANVNPGSTYTVSGTINLPAVQTGTIDGRARGITVYSWNAGTPSTAGQSAVATNTTGPKRVSVTFTVPSSATGLEIRLYDGATNTASNQVYWDSVMLVAGSTQYNFADGNSPNWVWNGTQDSSTSTGPAS